MYYGSRPILKINFKKHTHKKHTTILTYFYFIFDSHLFIYDFVPDDGPVLAGNLWMLAHEFNDFCFTCTTVNITTLTVGYKCMCVCMGLVA